MAELSEAEAAVYDRQLRVWGIEVQKRCVGPARHLVLHAVIRHSKVLLTVSAKPFLCRLNAAKILIAGCTGLAVEVWKQSQLHKLDLVRN